MKINKEDLPFLDLIWFAVDRFNKVIELTSGGNAILPDFIIKSVEDVEFLEKYLTALKQNHNKEKENNIEYDRER